MKRTSELEVLHQVLNLQVYGGALPATRVLLRKNWRGPRFGVYIPEVIMISEPWYEYHRTRTDPETGLLYSTVLLLHEMAHQAARVLLGDPTAGADHGETFKRAAVPGVETHAPLAPGFLRTLPVRFKYVCPLCRTGWALPYALSKEERVCLTCAAEHGNEKARVQLAARRNEPRR